MLMGDMLSRNAGLYGDQVSLVDIDTDLPSRRELTWREFDERANRFSNLLLSRGLKKGDKVAVLLRNCLEWLPIYFGILRSGAVAVCLNTLFTEDEIRHCLELVKARALVFGPEFSDCAGKVCRGLPAIRLRLLVGKVPPPPFADSAERLAASCSDAAPGVELGEEDEAGIYFSSGTTGFPKAILLVQRNLVGACLTELNDHHQTKEDNFLCMPPLYHTGAKMHWFGNLPVGAKAVLLHGKESKSPQQILRTISEEKVTIVWLLVPWAQDILDSVERGDVKLEDYRLSQWRLLHIGAQPVPPELIRRWRKVFPGQLYDTTYGLTEAGGPGCIHLGMENVGKVGAIGRPAPGWDARIVDDAGAPVPSGKIGELAVKGPGVMKGYFNDPQATASVLKDGWLLTGDLARVDGDGFIWLVDRKKDIIIRSGENIYPVQIEDFLHEHPAVADAAVIGIPDRCRGEVVGAVVERKPGCSCSEEEILGFCSRLPKYKRPVKVFFGEVPRNSTGKIKKQLLKEKYCEPEKAVRTGKL